MTNVLSRIINSNAKVELLGFLLDRSEFEMTVSDLSRLSNLPKSTVALIISDWYDAALVETRTQGKNKLVKVNPKCYLLNPLKKLLEADQYHLQPLLNRLKRVKSLQDNSVKAIVVFGSRARGTHRGRSDLDILIVIERANGPLTEKITEELVYLTIGMKLRFSPLIINKVDFTSRIVEGDKLIKNILSDGKIVKGDDFIQRIHRSPKSS